jgi:hypothetical protein
VTIAVAIANALIAYKGEIGSSFSPSRRIDSEAFISMVYPDVVFSVGKEGSDVFLGLTIGLGPIVGLLIPRFERN